MTKMELSRRGLMGGLAAVAGVAAAGLGPEAGAADGATGGSLADAVVAAFRRHRIVAVGEVHGQQEHHDALQALLLDPRLPGVVDDIVVEFGNARYQERIDRFVAGPAVQDRDLRPVWRDTTQSPVATWDAPMYEQFYRTVRAANWALPRGRRMRVLLGDPPVDWSRVTSRDDVASLDRDGHLVSVVRRQVLDRGRRALICYGSNHVKHAPPGAQGGGGVARLEQQTGQRAYVILSGGHPRLAGSPRRRVVPAAGTWLAAADTSEFAYFSGACGIPFGAVSVLKSRTRLSLVAVDDIGRAAAAIAEPERFDRVELDLAGDYLSMAEIAEVLSGALGVELSAPELTEVQALAAGMPAMGASHGWLNVIGQPGRPSCATELGIPVTSFATWARERLRAEISGSRPG